MLRYTDLHTPIKSTGLRNRNMKTSIYERVLRLLVNLPEDHIIVGKDNTTVSSSVPPRPSGIADRLLRPFVEHN